MPLTERSPATGLDEIDLHILDLVANDARISNAQLAATIGVAPSTAHARMKALLDKGVITGFATVVDQRRLGRSLHALIGVTLRPGERKESISSVEAEIRTRPEVVQSFFIGGIDDFIVHIAVSDSSTLRAFVVEQISGHPRVASTRTNIIFDYYRASVVSSFD
ncbi:Lrp/AsnC family transcriptional regulator [Microbacterium aerolatum]|uniref:Lrp/AsnC family transcriptional regulator n=1 Tax=Microbacterium aerolatum TaxID=153731 RepID=UPI00384CC615